MKTKSFTADEIWRVLPGAELAPERSVFVQEWHQFPDVSEAATISDAQWVHLLAVREGVKKALEELRAQEKIGSGLDAAVTVYAQGEQAEALKAVGGELRFWLITSEAAVSPLAEAAAAQALEIKPAAQPGQAAESVWVLAKESGDTKCGRCWHRRPDVGQHAEHPLLCGRCAENISGAGERRQYI